LLQYCRADRLDTTIFQERRKMGKGDRKTAKGKRFNSSYGNARRHVLPVVAHAGASGEVKQAAPAAAPAAKKAVAKKAVVKKAAAKKSAAAE
jgi:30S ribosomal protein S31